MKIKNLILQFLSLLFAVGLIGLTPTRIDSIEIIYSLRVKYPSVFPLTDDDKIWIENKLNKMSIREKCAQLIMPAVYRNDLNPNSTAYERIMSLVKDKKIGGLILFQGGMEEQIKFINQVQEMADIPLLIASDFERGLGTRIDDALEFPHAMALGSTGNSVYAFEVGRITALESRLIGVHQNFAPVADINDNPMNPVINIRSYSEKKEEVIKFVKAFINGSKGSRIITTAKHFPGHGNTEVDSHYDLPRIKGSLDYLVSNELLPFTEAIESGVHSIMIGHLDVPALEPVRGVPSSLSKSVITHLLKNKLGFEGLIVTDAMIMDAVSKYYSDEEATVMAIEAGNDLILMPPDELVSIDALADAVSSGKITMERLDESVRKILAAKRWLKIENEKTTALSSINKLKSGNPNYELAKKIASASITLLRNDQNLIPLEINDYKNVFCITITDKRASNRTKYFSEILNKRIGKTNSYLLTSKTKRNEYSQVLSEVDSADLIILPSFIEVKTYKGPVNLSAEQIDFIAEVLKKDIPTILISLRNPYLIYLFPESRTYLNSFSYSYPSQDAMLCAILGEGDIKGKLPITIPETELTFGTGIEIQKINTTILSYGLLENFSEGKIDAQIEHSISENLFPGAVVLAAIDGKIFYHKAFGRSGFGASNYFIQKDDVFSIGKLTGLYTIASALKLIDEKKISAESELEYFFDEINESRMSRIAISDLILHRSGIGKKLTNLKSYWTRDDLIVNIFREYIPNRIGNQPEFSSLNMILLQDVIEIVSGEKLQKYFEENFREPLNIHKSGYSYTRKDSGQFYYNPSHSVTFAASTQDDLIKTILEGETEGSSGFDGFFTNVSELAIFLQMMLQKGYYDHIQILNAETVDSWINGFSNDLTSNNRIYELIDPGGCFINLNFEENYFIIALTNAGIKNVNNSSFNDFSKKLIKIFEEEISRNIL